MEDFVIQPLRQGEYFIATLKECPQVVGGGKTPAEAAVDLICHLPNDIAIEAFEGGVDDLQPVWALRYFAEHAHDSVRTRARTMLVALELEG